MLWESLQARSSGVVCPMYSMFGRRSGDSTSLSDNLLIVTDRRRCEPPAKRGYRQVDQVELADNPTLRGGSKSTSG